MVFIKVPGEKRTIYLSENPIDVVHVRTYVAKSLNTPDFSLFYNGKELSMGQVLENDSVIHVTFSLPGGKGGFGSMLRAIGAQIEKTTNREACRDLSGRRLRDINEEERLKKWLSKEAERKAEKELKRKERIERLKSKPKHNFVDFDYEKQISTLPERVEDAMAEGLSKISKRKAEEAGGSSQGPKKKWLFDDMPDSSDSDSSEESSTESQPVDIAGPSTSDSSCTVDAMDSMTHQQSVEPSESESSMDITEETSHSNPENIQSGSSTDEKAELAPSSTNPECILVNSSAEENVLEIPKTLPETTSSLITGGQSEKKEVKVEETDAEDQRPIDLDLIQSISDLESLGMNRLKWALSTRGLKCGGSLTERAQRLWKVKGLLPNEYPSNLIAKKRK